jgi:hypothetical protein
MQKMLSWLGIIPAFFAVYVGNGGRKFMHTIKFFVGTCLHLVFTKLFSYLSSSAPTSSAIAAVFAFYKL